jgi:hypothetical protein
MDEELRYFGPTKNAKVGDSYASFVVFFCFIIVLLNFVLFFSWL